MEKAQQVSGSNNLNKGNDIRLVFTAAANAAAQSNLYIVAGVGSAAAKALPANVTIGGDYASIADWQNYAENIPMLMSEFRMETSNTANWENTILIIGERMPNGRNPIEKPFYMSDYQESVGNGLKKSIRITKEALGNGEGIVLTPQTYIRFEGILASSTITAYIRCTHVLRTYDLDPAQF